MLRLSLDTAWRQSKTSFNAHANANAINHQRCQNIIEDLTRQLSATRFHTLKTPTHTGFNDDEKTTQSLTRYAIQLNKVDILQAR